MISKNNKALHDITRKIYRNNGILSAVCHGSEGLVNLKLTNGKKLIAENYFTEGQQKQSGLPTISYMASNLNISPKYLSNLLKMESRKTALEVVHLFIINKAENRLHGERISISEIAYELEFEIPSYFSRLFK